MYNFRVFHRSSKAGIFVLVVKPREAIKVHVSMYINMLDMVLSHYGHVLGQGYGAEKSSKAPVCCNGRTDS